MAGLLGVFPAGSTSRSTLALLFPREVVSLDVLEHPRQDFQAALRIIATGPSQETSSRYREEEEAEHHAYHR